MPIFLERDPVIKAKIGSHNYNLHDDNSDEDYKIYVMPSFNDLYDGKRYSKMYLTARKDYSVGDIRGFFEQLIKGNVSAIEVLCSRDLHMADEDALQSLMVNELATMNLKGFFDSCYGNYTSRVKNLYRTTVKSGASIPRCGYNTKYAMHAYRYLDLVRRFAFTDFNDIYKAFYYEDDDPARDTLFRIKYGEMSHIDLITILTIQEERVKRLQEKMYAHPFNHQMSARLKLDIRAFVFKSITTGVKTLSGTLNIEEDELLTEKREFING